VAKAAEQAQVLRPHIERCIEAGRTSSSAIAADLNAAASRHRMVVDGFRCRLAVPAGASALPALPPDRPSTPGLLFLGVKSSARQLAMRAPNLFVNGNPVLVASTDHALPWFECPRCGKRRRHIFLDELACRTCLGLLHASRVLFRQTPGVRRITKWRIQIAADPHPFSDLPDYPHVHERRIAARIRAEEAALVRHLQTVTRDLERRIAVRKRKHQWSS
jgi:hypothetical protein